jgi:hypothetical protein
MFKWLSLLFSETSEVSCLRFMAVLALFFGFSLGIAGLWMGKDLSQVGILSGVFVGPAFAAKVGQKFAEVKSDNTSS